MRTKIAGYIVEGPNGPYSLGRSGEEAKLLWLNGAITIFRTRREARQALKNTKTYRDAHGYSWEWVDKSTIYQVEFKDAR
jgi:hypothetical protein